MFSGPKDNPYAPKSASSARWSLSIFAVLVVAIVFCVSLLLSYYLGLKAGKTSGLELAHENSLAQVLRMPVSKAIYDKQIEEPSKDKGSDIYKELSKNKQENNNTKIIQEPSKEVKEILKPTATASALKNQQEQPAVILEAQASPVVVKGKQENVESIRQALEQVNSSPTLSPELIPTLNDSIRVINPEINNVNQNVKVAEAEQLALNQQENFELERNGKVQAKPEATSTPKIKPTVKVSPTAVAKKTVAVPTPAKAQGSASKKLAAGWYTQVAAPKSLKEAQSLANTLKKSGFKAQIEEAQVGDQQYYRIVVGPDNARLSAEQNLSRLRKQSALKAEPFVRLVRPSD